VELLTGLVPVMAVGGVGAGVQLTITNVKIKNKMLKTKSFFTNIHLSSYRIS
jgi:hypothetical protein